MRKCRKIRTIISSRLFFILLSLLFFASVAHAQSASVANGLTWLKANQAADGNWGSLNSYRDTSAVVDSYRLLGQSDSSYQNALSWMNNFTLESNDFLAKRIISLIGSGADVSADISRIVSCQGTDGGWGYYPGFASNVYDTALVFQALFADRFDNKSVTSFGVSYLISRQNADGSWSVLPDSPGDVTLTSLVVAALKNYGYGTSVTNGLNKAVAWIATKQNVDGGFGSSPSTVHDTVYALTTLMQNGSLEGQTLETGLNYVTSIQAGDGSWQGNAYETAMALKLFASLKPNPAVFASDVAISSAQLKSGETLSISVTIRNTGGENAAGVPVRISINSPQQEVVQLGAVEVIPLMAVGGSALIERSFDTRNKEGEYTLHIEIDPDNILTELSKADNQTDRQVKIVATPDLIITNENVQVSKSSLDIGDDVTITATVTNDGNAAAYDVGIEYYVDSVFPENIIGSSYIPILLPRQSATRQTIWKSSKVGSGVVLHAVVDRENAIQELSKENNSAFTQVEVLAVTDANLTVSYKDLTFNPQTAMERGSVDIGIVVRNEGYAEAQSVDIAFYKGAPGEGGVLLATRTVSPLAPGAAVPVSYTWSNIMDAGEKLIYIAVDPTNAVTEFNETDNSAFLVLSILSLPELTIAPSSIVFNPVLPKDGDKVVINAAVQNMGQQSARNVLVKATRDGLVIGTQTFESLDGMLQTGMTLTFETIGTQGSSLISLAVDPDNTIVEQNESNNIAEKTLLVQNADLWVTEAYFSPNGDGVKDSAELIFRLNASATVTINIVNAKNETVRSFSGDTLANVTDGNIVWDGLAENGSVVDDGVYELQVVDRPSKSLTGAVPVAVDTNRSPLTDAIGTKYLLKNNMSCMLPDVSDYDWQWLPNESGVVFNIQYYDEDAPEYKTGLYSMAPDGQDVQRLIPSDWTADNPDYSYTSFDFRISPDGEKVAFVFWKYDVKNRQSWTELWLVDANGEHLTPLEPSDVSVHDLDGYIEGLEWSADHRYLAFTKRKYDSYNNQGREFWIADVTTGNKIKIDSEYPYSYYPSYKWSPDGKELAYLVTLNSSQWYFKYELKKTDVSGNKSTVFAFPDNSYVNGPEIQWLYNEKAVIQQNDGTWLYDMSGNGSHKLITDTYLFGDISVRPDKKGFSFYEYDESRVYLRLADENGNISTVYDAPVKWGEGPYSALSDMVWSKDSRKLAIVDTAYKALDACLYEPYLIVIDAGTKDRKALKASAAHCNESALACSWDDYNLCLNKTPLGMHVEGLVSWFPDNLHLLLQSSDGSYSNFEYPVMNSESGELKQSLPVPGSWNSSPTLSPIGRYITYYEDVDQSSACYGRGNSDFWAISSLLNLTVDLRATKSRSAIVLKGIASDLNFESYELEYADIKSPNAWTPVQPSSSIPVANEMFAVWVPPYQGTFLVRLTARDKAGNAAVDRKRVSWGEASSITNLYKTTEFISPNGDGAKDDVELHYRVLEPVNLEFTIYDPDERLVKTYTKSHTVPASDYIRWDGRDESGTVVPDGKYKIKVFDYEFFVEVDNAPPDINISLKRIGSEWVILTFFGGGGGDFSEPILRYFSAMEGHAVDKNLKSWTAEYRKSDGPDWSEYKHGTDTLAKKDDDGNLMLEPVKDAEIDKIADERLELLVGKEVRMRAEDFAANESIVFSGLLEERLILNKWDNKFVEFVIPSDKRRPGLHSIHGIETVRLPLVMVTVQYYYRDQWNDAPSALKDPASGMLSLEWDNSFMRPTDGYYVRLKGVDSLGTVYYSNIISTEQFSIITECDMHRVTAPDMPALKTPLFAVSTLSEELNALKLQVAPSIFGPWTNYHIFDASKGDVVPKGQFYPVLPAIEPGKTYYIRMIGVVLSSDGQKQDKYVGGPTLYPISCTSVDINVTYKEKEDCDALADTAEILGGIKNFKTNIALTSLSLSIKYTDEFQLLRVFDLAKGQNIVPVPIQTSSLAEGIYPVKAVLTYVDLDDNLVKEVFEETELIVDRVLPNAEITYPALNQMVCPADAAKNGENWLVVPVEGIASDNTAAKRFELFYGIGEDPAEWKQATAKIYDSEKKELVDVPITGPGVKGLLGQWAVSGFSEPGYSLKLKVIDYVGNVSCTTTSFTLDTSTEISYLNADKKIFSPNSDGVQDDVTVSFSIEEYATVAAKAFKLVQQGGIYVLDASPLRTIEAGMQHLGGAGLAVWDGKTDGGAVVPDGLYAVAVSVVDSCGNAHQLWVPVTVDNTPPTVTITYPKTGDTLGNIVEVKGGAEDLHFLSYTLEAGLSDGSNGWMEISSGSKAVISGVLGKWSTYPLADGVWTLRLTAVDSVGNTATATSEVTLGARQTLIKSLDVMPKLFSPNNDGKLEATTVTYEITGAADVTLAITDLQGATVKTHTASHSGPGLYSMVFEGRNASDSVVADGEYAVKLTAGLPSNSSISQTETVTAIVDTTVPLISISYPANNQYPSVQDVTVTGAITDQNMAVYTVKSAVNSGNILLDEGSQSCSDCVFGTLNALPEGDYTIAVSAKDLGENESNKNVGFTIDRTPPAVKLETPENGEYYGAEKNSITVNGSIVERNLAAFSLRYGTGGDPAYWIDLVSGSTLTAYPETFVWKVGPEDKIADGIYTLSLFAKDKAGLQGDARVKVTIDNTAPQTAITSPQEGSYVTAPIDIKGTAFDQNLDKYTLEISEGQCANAFKWALIKTSSTSVQDNSLATWQALPPDGDCCVRLTATDKVGQAADAKVDVKVDTHPPAAPVLSGNVESKTDAKLTWAGNTEPDLAGYNVYRGGQKINTQLVSGNQFLDQNLAEGTYEYVVKATDIAGWESDASNTLKMKIDLTGPPARIRSPQDGSWISGAIDIKGTAYSEDDFKQYRVYIGQGTSPESWNLVRTSPLAISYGVLTQWDTQGLSGGVYSIKLEAEDTSGNVTIHQISVSIDNTAPAKPATPTAAAAVSEITAAWASNSESDLAGYLIYRNDQLANVTGIVVGDLKPYLIAHVPGTTSYLDKSLPDGTYRYYVIAMDQAGNMSEQSDYSIDVVIDTRAPHAAITDPMDKASIGGKIIVKAESPDLDIASVQFQYQSIQSSPTATADWLDLGGPVTSATLMTNMDPSLLGLAYGDYRLRAVATDNGQKRDPAPGFITLTYTDLAPPAAPAGLNALVTGDTVSLTWSANTENDLAGYNVYRTTGNTRTMVNTALVTSVPPSYTDAEVGDASYAYTVTAVDTYGNESRPSNSASAKIYAPVITQPYTPAGQTSISVSGNNAAANSTVEIFVEDIAGYWLRGTTVADASGKFTASITLGLGSNRIIAHAADNAGNVSRDSEAVITVYDLAPAAPAGLAAEVLDHDVHLTWSSNAETDILGYNVYRDGVRLNGTDIVYPYDYAASSIDPYYEHEPWMAADYDSSTYWTPTGSVSPVLPGWWEANLGSPELINRLELFWGTDRDGSGNEVLCAGKDYEVQVWSSDANAWVTQTKVTGNAVKNNAFDFNPPYRTDRIRILITDSTDSNSAKQVRLAEVTIVKDNPIIPQAAPPAYDDPYLADKVYSYAVRAVDNYGFESPLSDNLNVTVGDVVPPSAPLELSATVLNSDVTLSWQNSGEPDTAGYNVYRASGQDWIKITSSPVSGSPYTDFHLVNGTYLYRITAKDGLGNESLPSNTATVTVYIAPPANPASLVVTSDTGGGLNAAWVYDGIAEGFNLYRSAVSGGPYSKVNNSLIREYSYLDTAVTSGTAYFYVVAAVDAAGNLSSYSNEASGTSADVVPPAKPVIFFPTTTGSPITVLTNNTDISGMAEPGSTVSLLRDGVFAGTTVALDHEEMQESGMDDYGDFGASLSPDGTQLAYSVYYQDTDSIWTRSIQTGLTELIVPDGYLPLWSPDGKRIAYSFWSNGERIGIYDVATGESAPLTDETYIYLHQQSPSWSADGKVLTFTKWSAGAQGLWRKDFASGELTEVVSVNGVNTQKLSPDGEKIAYSDNNGDLYIYDLAAGTTTLVDDNVDGWVIDWSSDSRKLAFVSYRNDNGKLYILDTEGGSQAPVNGLSGVPYEVSWTIGNNSLLVRIWDDAIGFESLWKADAEGEEEPQRITPDLPYIAFFDTTVSGETVIVGQTVSEEYRLFIQKPAGSFTLSAMQLAIGKNSFTATALDFSSNESDPSDPISVTYETSQSPDLVVSADDVYLYPPYPIAGDQMTVNIVVSNKGQVAVNDVGVDVYLWNSNGLVELLTSESIFSMAPGGAELVNAVWDSTGKVGENRLIVVVDPADIIPESVESNNLAIKDFYVADHLGVTMTAATDASQYKSGKAMAIDVTLRNSGPAKDAVLQVQIEDESGYPVSAFEFKNVTLAYASTASQSFAWNTGSTYAGGYVVHSVLKDTSGFTLAENTAPFTIIADSVLDLTVVTDKAAYGPGENVVTSFTIRNSGTNSIIPALQAAVSITDAVGTVLFSEPKAESNLLPGAAIDLSSLWNTGLTVPGNYTATVQVTFEGGTAVAKSAAFKINESLVLAGTITVSPSIVAVGNIAQVAYTVTNSGNADALAHTTKIVVLDPEAQTIMQSSEETADIAENTGKSGLVAINTTGYGLKTYVALLQSLYQGTTKNLASVSFTVNDLTPPVVAVTSPNADGLYRSTIALSVLASDNASGVDTVEYQTGDGAWKQLPIVDPASGRYGTSWEPTSADNGPQTVHFRATDKAGNTSAPVPVGFTIDTIPPVLTLSTLADGSYTNNTTLNIAGTATDNIAVQAVTINDAPVTLNADGSFSQAVALAEGSNTIVTTASDTAGNTTMDTRTIILDQTAPVITITNPADNSVTNKADIEVTGYIDTPSTIGIAVNGVTLPDIISGTTFTFQVTLAYGQNTIEVTTTDIATNSSTAKRTVILDNLSPALAITNPTQDITTNKAGILLQGTVDDLTGITVMITHDGTTYTPAVVNGTFEQQLAFTEEKQYPVIVTATDEAQNSSTVQRNIIYDKTPPVLSIDPVKTPTNSSQLVVTGTMEAGSTVTIACPTATIGLVSYPTDTTWQVIVAAMTEGENVVSATATDQTLNVSKPLVIVIVVDTQAPDTLIVSGPAALTNSSNALFTFLSTEDGSIFACRLDNGEYAECTSSAAFNGILDGDHTFQVRATDPAGNTDQTAAVLFWTVDTIPPFAVISGTPDSPTRETTALITIQGGDAVAYRYRLDSGGYSAEIALPTPIVLNNLTGGMHTLSVIARDSAGNWQPETNATTAAWTVDVQPPALTVSTLADGSITNNATLNIAGTATDNIAIQAVTINDTAIMINADGSFSQALKLITGSNKITTVAMDTAGNTTTDVRTIVLDQTSPVITIIEPADNSLTNYADIVVTGTVDKTAKVTIKLNGIGTGLEIVTESSFTFPVTLAYGQNLIEVTAVDLATNSGTAKRTVTFDNISPALAVTYPAQDITTNQSSIVLQGTVADLTGMTVTVTMDGTTYTPEVVDGTFQQALNFTEEKQYPAVVTATDAAGNSSTVQRNIIYDKTPPVLSIDPVKTPTNNSQQVVTGTMETGSTVTIVCPTATIGLVSYPTDTTWQMIVAAMTEGENLITATATDKTGNMSNPVNAAILMDTHAPVTTADPAAGVYTAALTVTLTPNEQAKTYFTTDGTTPSISSAVHSTPILISSSTTIKYFSIDAAGNYEAVKSAAYTLNAATKKSTTLTYTGPKFIAQGYSISLSGALRENGTGAPNLQGRTITISLGNQWCTGRTNASGNASCTISAVKAQPGFSIVSATFTGDENYLPSSDSASVTVFAYPSTGAFVIGDKNAVINKTVTFWGSRWAKKNSVSNGSVPSSFKGYADSLSAKPVTCGVSWTSNPGRSLNPPANIPLFMGVIVSSKITKSGSTISGNSQEIVVVRTDANYGPNPGHAGTGIVVGVICSSSPDCDHDDNDHDDNDHDDNDHDDNDHHDNDGRDSEEGRSEE